MRDFELFQVPVFANRLRNEVNRLFDSVAREGSGSGWPGAGYPALNIWEDGHNVYVEAEIPGVELKDLEILLERNELSISGERSRACAEGTACHRTERPTGRFRRTVRLPVEIESEGVDARLQHGVLTLTLPKAQTARVRKIEVKAS